MAAPGNTPESEEVNIPRPRRTRAAVGKSPGKSVDTLRHKKDTRTNIPTAEYQSMVREEPLKTTLLAETDEDACATLRRARSLPFPKLGSCCIAVKVINHLGDEVMKVMTVH